ncbi:MAG: cytidylate kinase-like family protein [Clostridia bacterium]|nr:cytidylate kinase-like family protein [Clostridia bacterium]
MQIITINREFGSGGRELGKRLAESLGYAYYDRSIIEELSKKLSLDENYLERTLETNWSQYNLSFGHTLSSSRFSTQSSLLLAEQHKIVKRIAEQGNCVIVGANADVILKELKPLRIFVYADMESKINRCRERATESENISDHDWAQKIKSIDKGRMSKHELVSSDYPWGDKRNYDLCINTSTVVIKEIISAIKQFAKTHFKEEKNGD